MEIEVSDGAFARVTPSDWSESRSQYPMYRIGTGRRRVANWCQKNEEQEQRSQPVPAPLTRVVHRRAPGAKEQQVAHAYRGAGIVVTFA